MSITEEVRFGPFRLARKGRTLATEAGPVALSSRAFDVLATLIEAGGSIVSKDELMRRVWPNVIVEENNLHVQIAGARRALGSHQNYIVTVPGRGYCFAGEVESPLTPLPDATQDKAPAVAASERLAMPAETAPLIGREAELAELQHILSRNRLVTVTGPGGIGKTRLAVALGNAVADKFPGGARLIDLSPLADASLVEAAAAAALGIRLTGEATPIERFCAALGREPALLIFDNCEHLLGGVAALVAELLRRCEAVSVLATSQEPLRIAAETTYRLEPLTVPQSPATDVRALEQFGAVALFVSRVEAVDRRFALRPENGAAVAEICQRLDGIPLALEMAAARVPALGIEGVRLRLGERLRMLTTGARNAATRHRTLRDTVAWSYELLDAQDQAVFRRLGVFAGGFSAAAVQATTTAAAVHANNDADEWTTLDALSRLIDKSLVVVDPGEPPRYRLLETLRLFAVEQLAAHGEQAALLRRHAEYFEGFFASAYDEWEDTGDAVWLARNGVEVDNLRAALDWALQDPGAANLAISLAGSAGRLWDRVAPLAEGRRALERAEALLTPDTPPAIAARLHRQIGILWLASDRPRALAALLRAEALYRRLDDQANLGAVLTLVGPVHSFLGASAEARRTLHEARTILEVSGRRKSLFNVMNNLGALAWVDGDMTAARELFTQALQIARRWSERDGEVMALMNLAEIEFNLGQFDAAVERTGTAVAYLRGTGQQADLGWALVNLATYLLILGRLPEAAQAAREALALVRPVGGFILRVCLQQWALLAAGAGQLADAARLAGFVDAGYERAGETREPIERRVRDQLQAELQAGLTASGLAGYIAEGEAWSEAQAAAFANWLGEALPAEGRLAAVDPEQSPPQRVNTFEPPEQRV